MFSQNKKSKKNKLKFTYSNPNLNKLIIHALDIILVIDKNDCKDLSENYEIPISVDDEDYICINDVIQILNSSFELLEIIGDKMEISDLVFVKTYKGYDYYNVVLE